MSSVANKPEKRRLKLLTASKTKLAWLCTAWLAADSVWTELSSAKSDTGHVAHAEIQHGLEQYKAFYLASEGSPPTPKPGYFAQALDFLLAFELDHWGPMEVERSYGTTGSVGKGLGYNRAYSDPPEGTWLVGTADVVIPEYGHLTIVDWKTGFAGRAFDQLVAMGALASEGYLDTDTLHILSVHVEEGCWEVGISHKMSIGEARSSMARLQKRLSYGPSMTPGEHCFLEFCPAALACRGVKEYSTGMSSGSDKSEKGKPPPVEEVPDLATLSDATVLDMWTREKVRASYAKKATDILEREMHRRGGLETPTGKLTHSKQGWRTKKSASGGSEGSG